MKIREKTGEAREVMYGGSAGRRATKRPVVKKLVKGG